MATYGAIKTRIADELDRSDLTSQIADAVRLTIKRYEAENLYFLHARDLTLTTVADQALYTSADEDWIPDVVRLDEAYITVGGQFRRLRKGGSAFDLEFISDASPSTGQPWEWAYYAQGIRLYPVPDGAYAVRFYGLKRLTALSADGDTNAWTDEGEDLLVSGAKRWLLQHVVRDAAYAQAMAIAENEALQRLRAETSIRTATGMIEATAF